MGETGPRAQPHGMEPPNQLPIPANPHTLDCRITAARCEGAATVAFGRVGDRAKCFGRITCAGGDHDATAKPVVVRERALLIAINQTYRSGMSGLEWYEATRGFWVIGPRRDRVEVVMAMSQGGCPRGVPDSRVVSSRDARRTRRATRLHTEAAAAGNLRGRSPRTYVMRTRDRASARADRTPFATSTSDWKRLAPADVRDGVPKKM